MQHVDTVLGLSSAKDAGILNINIQMLLRWKGTYTDFKQYMNIMNTKIPTG